tara:strand:- start:227 stop:622 length:396 start_codon:yes stop_codon:yes gene_type:complete
MLEVITADGRPVKLTRKRGEHLVRVEFISTKGLDVVARIPEDGLADFIEGLADSYAADRGRNGLARQGRLIPLTQWSEYHPWPALRGLRHLVFNAHTNGFDKVIKRAGRRVLIDESAFFRWVDEQNDGAAH